MKLNGNSLDEVLKKETLSDEDIVFLLGLTDPEDCTKLQQAAYEKTTELMGNKVYYRGLIEVSNVCTVDCRYCGIRKDNHVVSRYTLTKKEILSAVCGRKRLWKHLSSGRRAQRSEVRFIHL